MATDRVRIVGRIRRGVYNKVVAASKRMNVPKSMILEQALANWLGQDSVVLDTKRNGHGRVR